MRPSARITAPPPPLTERADSAPRRSSSLAGAGGGGGGGSAAGGGEGSSTVGPSSDQGGAAWPPPAAAPRRRAPLPPLYDESSAPASSRPLRWLETAVFGSREAPFTAEGAQPLRGQEQQQRQRQGQQQRGRPSSSSAGQQDVELGQEDEDEGHEDDGYGDEDGYDEEEEEEDDEEEDDDDGARRRRHRSLKAPPAAGSDDDDGDDDDDAYGRKDDGTDLDEALARPSHAQVVGEAGAAAKGAATAAAAEAAATTAAAAAGRRQQRASSFVPVRRSVAEAFLVPDGRIKYWPAFTLTATVLFVGVFAFMAGGYGGYLAQEQLQRRAAAATAAAAPSSNNNAAAAAAPSLSQPPLLPDPPQPAWWATPRNMGSWLAFWRPTSQTTFAWPYLAAWGGRYAPALLKKRGGWRVVASLGLHASAAHLASNLLVLLLLSAHLEHSYGPLRVGAAFFASCIGGTFLSLAFEDPCALYVGASGGVYGLVGLYVLSIAVNHETMPLWWLRLGAMVVSICFMIVVAAVPAPKEGLGGVGQAGAGGEAGGGAAPPPARNGTSHLSHLGGFLTGLLAAFLFLPNFKDRRWRAARRVAKRLGRALPGVRGRSGSGSGGGGGNSSVAGADAATASGAGGGLFAAAAPSCWRVRRPLFRAVAALSVSSVVFLMVALPVYAWTSLLPGLSCPDEDALLASIDAPA